MRLISAHHDSIMTVVNVEHVAVPSHEPLVDFPFLMELVQSFRLYNVELLATPSKIREVAKVESQVPYTESFLKRSDLEHCESKVLMIPPPMSF